MDLGARLRQARQEAGLSQRQLCGDVITRNMLSQIENGAAKPSMDTLRYLAVRLGKPVGYFLEDEAVTSPNQQIMAQARQATGQAALDALAQYKAPDETFDRERWLLETLVCLELAEDAIRQDKSGYARALLERAANAGAQTPYFTEDLERRRLLLCYRAGISAKELADCLPELTEELLLRAEAAQQSGDLTRSGAILDGADQKNKQWYLLRGETFFGQRDYTAAIECYLHAEPCDRVYGRLEQCYRELEDYKQAYFYACKQRK